MQGEVPGPPKGLKAQVTTPVGWVAKDRTRDCREMKVICSPAMGLVGLVVTVIVGLWGTRVVTPSALAGP